jgi:ABC-type uncharacterized transport system ATPase subunit
MRYLIHRLTTYPLSEIAQKHELQIVTHILHGNRFYNQQLNTLQNNMKKKKKVHQNINNPKKRSCLHIPTER